MSTEEDFLAWLNSVYLHHHVFTRGDMRAAFAAGARKAGPGKSSLSPGPETPLTSTEDISGH